MEARRAARSGRRGEGMGERGHRVVVAIDMGTSGSTWCYTNDGTKGIARLDNSKKQPTVLLLRLVDPSTRVVEDDGDVTVVAVGQQALDLWSKSLRNDEEERMQHILVDRFKMRLHDSKEIGGDPIIPLDGTASGIRLSVIVVKLLEYFAIDIRTSMRNARGFSPEQIDNALWVLTVPAIWNDGAKALMRKCAYRAGLIDTQDSRNYLPCLEPEGVLFSSLEGEGLLQGLEVGDRVLVVDCGGGTVDFSFLEVTSPPTGGPVVVKSIGKAFGHGYGGVSVERAYLRYIQRLIGEENFALLDQHTLRLLLSELHKVGLNRCFENPDLKEVLVNISALSLSLGREAEKYSSSLTAHAIPSSTIKSFYDVAVENTRQKVHMVCSRPESERPKYVLVAGGFGESKCLYEAIESCALDATGGRVEVVQDKEPGLAIVTGALLWGCAPGRVCARTVEATYGILADRTRRDGSGIVDKAFSAHVYEGQEVPVGHVPEKLKEYGLNLLGRQEIELLSTHSITAKDEKEKYDPVYGWALDRLGLDVARDFRCVGTLRFTATEADVPVTFKVTYGGTDIAMEVLDRRGARIPDQVFEPHQ